MDLNEVVRNSIIESKPEHVISCMKEKCSDEIRDIVKRTNKDFDIAVKQFNIDPYVLKSICTGMVDEVNLETLIKILISIGYNVNLDIKSNHS